MRLPRGITLKITLLGWMVTVVTLAVFVTMIIPEQEREFQLSLESKARGIAVSIRGVAAGAAISEDYSAVVDQSMQVLSGDSAIAYVVIAKNDGFALIIDRDSWRTDTLGSGWHPAERAPVRSIAFSPLVKRRVFQYAFPFDYSSIPWGWIHIGLSLDSYDESVRRLYQGTGALAIICGGLSLLISLAFAGRLVRPIHVLRATVEKVAKGDLRARAEIASHDEIERLAEAFNDMAHTILGRNQILESVSFAAKQFLSDGDRDTIFAQVLERVGQAAHASRGSIFRRDGESGKLCMVQEGEWLAPDEHSSLGGWVAFPWHGEAAAAWLEDLRQGRTVTVAPEQCDEPLRQSIDFRVQSAIFVPVVVGDEWWGMVSFDDFRRARQWSDAEQDSLRAVADMLGAYIARHRVQRALVEAKQTLEQRVIERTRELQEQIEAKDRAHADLAAAQQRLIELSRGAGMAEVATGVLHNVGNVLNSVNVSASLVAGKVRESRVDNLVSAIRMLELHAGNLEEFIERDPKGQRVLPYLAKLGSHFRAERESLLSELEALSSHVGHIKQIVATQQSYAKVSGLVENVHLADLVEDALRIVESGLVRHGIRVERDFESLPPIAAEKHSILQILLNLLRNAKEAVSEGDESRHGLIRIRIHRLEEGRVSLSVEDNGIGLPAENLTKIFRHGFTTRVDGHGFGLHSCALAARQMGGSLRAESPGRGQGATFTLELPIKTAEDPRKRVLA
ncbi:MAG TPA: ATP-binding protein [Bryobacteraceae bacterium]|nr:ATP-binding protein [Bryobacteraceae bacterium]